MSANIKGDDIVTGVDLVIEQLAGKTRHPRISAAYQLGLLLVAICMILLPVLYLGLIAAVGFLTYRHALHGGAVFEHLEGFMALLVYLGPIAVGIILILFMVKPLFAKPAPKSKEVVVEPSEQPLLFTYLNALCDNLGAPTPDKVVIDANVNASAGFTKGDLGGLTNRLTLTIGTPLISGLSLEQLTGVLAHEFGHFSQSGGMRFSYIIRSINNWFLRVVYERDAMDEWLERIKSHIDVRVGIFLWLASFFVWVSRWILWALMRAGDLISCYLLRQMEFDADLNEIHIVGSKTFETSFLRFIELGIGELEAQAALSAGFMEGRMSSDYGGMVRNYANELKPEVMQQVKEEQEKEKTALLSTHPCTRERIEKAHEVNNQGVVSSSGESRQLFTGYDALTEEVSTNLYHLVFGDAMQQIEICSNNEMIERRKAETVDFDGLESFFKGQASFLRPIELPEQLPETAAISADAWEAIHSDWEKSVPEYEAAFKSYSECVEQSETLERIRALYQCYLVWKEKTLGFPMATPAEIDDAYDKILTAQSSVSTTLEEWEALSGARLAHALSLCGGSIPESSAEEIDRLYSTLVEVVKMIPKFHEMREHIIHLEAIFQASEAELKSNQMADQAYKAADLISVALKDIQGDLATLMYPFDHAQGEISLDKLFIEVFPEKDLGAIYNAAQSAYQNVMQLYYRLLGRLGRIAGAAQPSKEKAETDSICSKPGSPDLLSDPE